MRRLNPVDHLEPSEPVESLEPSDSPTLTERRMSAMPNRQQRARSFRRARFVTSAMCIAFVLVGLTGCATRYSRHPIINLLVVDLDLVTESQGLFGTKAQGFDHPAVISKERLVHILNAIEVETPIDGGGFIRQPAFHPSVVEDAAAAMAEGFSRANADQRLGVKLIRKEQSLGVFHSKFLTSLLAYMRDGHLYVVLSRVDWPIPQSKEGKKLPEPRPDTQPMKFRVVSGEHLFYAGRQALEIEWQDSVFRTAYYLPGTSGGEKRKREVLVQSPIPKDELRQARDGELPLDELSPEQLRELANLEEDRLEGRITESAYQRAKRQLLRSR
jgi:hypothetical protein